MRNIIDILWNRNTEQTESQSERSLSFELPPLPENFSSNEAADVEEVVQLGQENEAFRQLFMEAQRRIDDLEALRTSFSQLAAPLDRNLRTIELEKVENASLRAGVFCIRAAPLRHVSALTSHRFIPALLITSHAPADLPRADSPDRPGSFPALGFRPRGGGDFGVPRCIAR